MTKKRNTTDTSKNEDRRLRTKKHFNGLLRNPKRERPGTEEATKNKEKNKPCTKEEYERLALIHRRLNDLRKLLRSSKKNYEKVGYKQIKLDEDLTEFWPTIENIAWSLGINLSGKLVVMKEIIFNKEIQTSFSGIGDLLSSWCYVDGKCVDEIELANMMKEEYERASQPRYDLIQDLDRIMVRLAKCFSANREVKLEQPSHRKPAKTIQIDESSTYTDNGLKKAERLAYQSYEYAIGKKAELADSSDNLVHRWLKENGTGEADYELPSCDTWKRQVRAGRKYHGTQKNTPRAGRQKRSTIKSNQIDSLSEISSQYDKEAD
jgi:hypothetical protein